MEYRVGDTVTVHQKIEDGCKWDPVGRMDSLIGSQGEILGISGDRICVHFPSGYNWSFNPKCFEKPEGIDSRPRKDYQVNEFVRIVKKATSDCYGFTIWISEMDNLIGEIGYISAVKDTIIYVKFKDKTWCLCYSSIEKTGCPFKYEDIITGIKGNPTNYGVTDEDSACRVIGYEYGESIRVKVISCRNKTYVGDIYLVNYQYFTLHGPSGVEGVVKEAPVEVSADRESKVHISLEIKRFPVFSLNR